ncbi:MAG: bifunctional nuclease family protein [Candidatus Krumholzibacteriota bacterium]|nr:bifunctional nuclease family protein [Candidatus Krumholzibacteriota bacterium]
MREVVVSALAMDKEREYPVVLLKASEKSAVLPIWIGPAEASSIFTVLAGKSFQRPMTHDLMRIIVDVLEAEVSSVEITGISKNTYFARIVLRRDEDIFYVDARPSDSIALALRCKASIFVDNDLFDEYSRKMSIKKDDEEGHLDRIDPEDFGFFDL